MRILLIILSLFSVTCSIGQKNIFKPLHTDSLRPVVYDLNFEKDCRGGEKIKRGSKHEVTFSFFLDRSDTISLYVNNVMVFSRSVPRDTEIVSTDYTGIGFTLRFPGKKNTIMVAYQEKKAYYKFELDKKYPLYALYALGNGKFYVSGRKCVMVIK